MKICILTQPLGDNYGGILQAYALQKVLRDLGHDVTTLRFPPPNHRYSSRLSLCWLTFMRWLSKMKGNKKIIRCNPEREGRYYYEVSKGIQAFIKNNIHTIKVKAPLNYDKLPKYDVFVVGSDQVWRPSFSPCLTNFYLDFLEGKKVKKVAYAASFGVDTWEADPEITPVLRRLAKQFDWITVRENSAILLCQKYLDVQASLVLDPTFLLDKYVYDAFVKPQGNQPYIAAYILDENDTILSYVNAISDNLGIQVKYLGRFNWETGKESIEDWLSDIANAEYVITDSFHGSVFSLIFQKQFLTVSNINRGTTRLASLFTEFELLDHLITPNDLTKIIIPKYIDYCMVSPKIEQIKQQSLSYLKRI